MALTVAEQQSAGTNSGASMTLTLAAGSAIGDLLVVIHANDFDTLADLQTPTGTAASTWTLRDSFDGGSNLSHIKVWTAPVTTAGAATVIATSTSTTNERGVGLWRIPGAVFDVANHANGATSTSHAAPSLTPAGTDEIYCVLWTGNDGGGGNYNYTYPGGAFVGLTERDVGTFATFGFGYEPITSGAATGTRTATASVTHPWCAAAVLVKAAVTASPDPGPPLWTVPGLFQAPGSVPSPWSGTDGTTVIQAATGAPGVAVVGLLAPGLGQPGLATTAAPAGSQPYPVYPISQYGGFH